MGLRLLGKSGLLVGASDWESGFLRFIPSSATDSVAFGKSLHLSVVIFTAL